MSLYSVAGTSGALERAMGSDRAGCVLTAEDYVDPVRWKAIAAGRRTRERWTRRPGRAVGGGR
jgi:hypothetical protein